jgi:hypothetical protein
MLSIGILFDFLIDFTEVLSGDGGVVATSCLHYTYDANGSMTKNGNKSITWTSFNKPKQFTKGTDSTTFTYGPDRSRYQKVQGMGAINTINSVITVITDIRFVGDIAIDVVLVTNGITIINIINLTGGA